MIIARRTHSDERGIAAVWTAVILLFLIGATALAVDTSEFFQQARSQQRAADLACLAGAAELPSNPTLAVEKAADFVRPNQPGLHAISPSVPTSVAGNVSTWLSGEFILEVETPALFGGSSDPNVMRVSLRQEVPTRFGTALGASSTSIRQEAFCLVTSSGGGGYAIFAGSTSCSNTVDWSGSTTYVTGGVHSNNDIHVGGQTNVVEGQATYLTSIDAPDDKITFIPDTGNPTQLPDPLTYADIGVNYQIADYQPGGARAVAAGSDYHSAGSDKIDMGWLESRGLWNDTTKTMADGIYYTEDDIDLSASEINGTVTLVSSDGVISLSGSEHHLTPWDSNDLSDPDDDLDGLLIFSNRLHGGGSSACSSAVVKMAGSQHDWAGTIFAPRGLIEMSGSSNTTLNGSLIGYAVKLNGSELNITYDKDSEAGEYEVKLVPAP